jgi:hypothetical protein
MRILKVGKPALGCLTVARNAVLLSHSSGGLAMSRIMFANANRPVEALRLPGRR